jgi:hypothetical protein
MHLPANLTSESLLLAGLATVCCVLFTGCGKTPYEVAPVQGRVTIDGRPVTQADIMFAPRAKAGTPNAGKPAFARLDDNGYFILSTYSEKDGAVVGDHTVTVSRARNAAGNTTDLSVHSAPMFRSIIVPGTFTVTLDQDNQIDIALTSHDIARYARRD